MTASRPTRFLLGALLQLWMPALVVVLLFVATANSTSFYFPPFSEVLVALKDAFVEGDLLSDLLFSLKNLVAGLAIAIVAGTVIGTVIAETEWFRVASQPVLDFARATPMVSFTPVIILTLGIGAAPKIFLISLGAFWPILLNTIAGVHGISPAVRESVRAYRIGPLLRLRKVLIPGAAPQILAGIRISLAVAIVMMIVSEIYGSPEGLGYFILTSGSSFHVADTWAGTLLIGLLGYALTLLLMAVEYLSLGWYVQRAPRTRARDRRAVASVDPAAVPAA
ncbi:ABC transporter permease [Nocardioides mangrovi]|uniref:ABC transporter permease subunit n=1 Tax=Nocardioides mangrovi TaxID=2874580 RepID=A0ABS7UF97_9ACTN|nr:ABC transporter permease subunit [Nocardioides mangrovi]MBZ5739552.1 ABC transporter permease subunit [Nocardioides mangrovi]